jgi:hypothetical protein
MAMPFFEKPYLKKIPQAGASSQPENASHFSESRHRRLQSEMGLTHFAF